jgi:lipopolysaccharide biosynthesis protein
MEQNIYLIIAVAFALVFVWGFTHMHKSNNRFEDQATMLRALLKRDEMISAVDISSAASRANQMESMYYRDHESVQNGFTKIAKEVPEILDTQSRRLGTLHASMEQLNQRQGEALHGIENITSLAENTASNDGILQVRREQSNAQQQRSELHGQMKESLATFEQRFSVIEAAVQSLGGNQQNIAQSVQQSQTTLSHQIAQFKNEVLNQ